MLKNIIILFFISCFSFAQNHIEKYLLHHDNISFPLDNSGILGDVFNGDSSQIRYKTKPVIFSAGIMLSGKNGNGLWFNGTISIFRYNDFIPGSYINSQMDSLAYLYVLKKNQKPFGPSWKNWTNAVKLGASFYDGDKDGLYNPVDKNGNGTWDENEDRPDLLGDETIWCVYKDAASPEDRRFFDMLPQGIEIQQTVFTTGSTPELKNTVFVRYKIINSGFVTGKLDSVYFSAIVDADIGNYNDDLIGCDTTFNTGFCYQNEPDELFGQNTPALLVSLANGPFSYIPGVTFEDLNSNNIYDSDDIPLDSAIIIKGKVLGTGKKPGATNLGMTSFMQYVNIWPTAYPYDSPVALRNLMQGKIYNGNYIDPCEWLMGKVINEDCKNIDGKFMYSGDPVYLKGWINSTNMDQIFLLNTGPFELKVNEPVEITIAYVVGEGDSPLESLKLAKINSRTINFLFRNNIFEISQDTTAKTKKQKIIYDFVLYQNYPNPFNSGTNIRYTLHRKGFTTLKIYDPLGRKLFTPVNEYQSEGVHTVKFDGKNLPAGVYFYTLTQGAFTETKKMILLK